MIRVIIGYKVKKDADIQQMLFRLRSYAMTFPGFIGAENLISEQDRSIVAMIQTWDRLEDWKAWEPSKIRQSILREGAGLLEEPPRVTIYRVVPSAGWTCVGRGS